MGTYFSKESGNELIFSFKGEMDTFTCMENEERILSLIREHKGKVVFDLKEVIYISSSFIRLSGSAAVIIGKDNLVIQNINSEVKKIFTKLGMANTFIIK